MRRISALARLISLEGTSPLTENDYYLILADVLMDFAEKHSVSSGAAEIAGYANAFGNDVLHMAVIAASLLWFEGVTPDMSRSPDLVRVSADVENYLVLLQTACDIMADVIRRFGIPPKRRGQAPEDSFHRLYNWARNNTGKLTQAFEIVGSNLPWFDEINGIRTKIVHRGYHCVIFTNRLSFSMGLAPPDIDFAERREKVQLTPLLPTLKRLTLSTLEFSDSLAQAIMTQEGISASHIHVLNGVYVPALHHLQQYETPTASPFNTVAAACLLQLRDYLTASNIGYPSDYWWVFLVALSELLGTPIGMSSPGYVASGTLVDWTLVFQKDQKRVAIKAQYSGVLVKNVLEAARQAIITEYGALDAIIFVCRRLSKTREDMPPQYDEDVIASDDPRDAARRVFQRLNVREE